MYLFRAPNCTYYTRICLPKELRDRGFPFDLKISLLSKYRCEAVIRNATVTLVVKKVLEGVANNTTLEAFKWAVNQGINNVRLSFSSSGNHKIPSRNIEITQDKKSQTTLIPFENRGISLVEALNRFIESKSKESAKSAYGSTIKATRKTLYQHNTTPQQLVSDITSASALEFVYWYNNEHRHSRIKFVTPCQRHDGLDVEIPAKRKVLYQTKRNKHPERWSKEERNWQPIGAVELNPEQHKEAA
jgi:hypothetical protein